MGNGQIKYQNNTLHFSPNGSFVNVITVIFYGFPFWSIFRGN
jgi:hypothetical protein